MSLTNPNKVVTEERLSEFYTGIFPYLGGMPEMVANKFSKSDIYSSTEKMIGQWTDGKPLYQKTITATITQAMTWEDTTFSLSNINIVDIKGIKNFGADTAILSYPSNDAQREDSSSSTASVYWGIQLRESINHYLSVKLSRSTSSSTPTYPFNVYITVQYTKTTDSAIAIGDANDYSTTEKIVGTWIDGKPLYQKTFTGTASGTEADLFTITGADKVVKTDGIITSGSYTFNLNYAQGTTNYFSIFASSNQIKWRSGNNTQYNYFITVQYTKTTD